MKVVSNAIRKFAENFPSTNKAEKSNKLHESSPGMADGLTNNLQDALAFLNPSTAQGKVSDVSPKLLDSIHSGPPQDFNTKMAVCVQAFHAATDETVKMRQLASASRLALREADPIVFGNEVTAAELGSGISHLYNGIRLMSREKDLINFVLDSSKLPESMKNIIREKMNATST